MSKNTISFFIVQEFDVTLIEDGFSLKTVCIQQENNFIKYV